MSTSIEYVIGLTDHQAVEQFIERFARSAETNGYAPRPRCLNETTSDVEVRAALDQLLAEHGLGVDAWSIGDDVETAFQYGLGATGDTLSPRVCESLRIVRQAALDCGSRAVRSSAAHRGTVRVTVSPVRVDDTTARRGPAKRPARGPAAGQPPVAISAPVAARERVTGKLPVIQALR